jgi:DNA-binding FadR family transcriptional regulator
VLEPVQKVSLATSVFQQIRGLVLSGKLEPGSELPSERTLAETLQVNRSAVREALKRLEQAGLVAIQHGGNTRVLDYRQHAGLDLIVAVVQHDPGRLDDLRALRTALLPEVARAAAENASADQIDRLEMLAGLLESDDAEQQRDLAAEFWNALVDASDNLAFRLVYNVIRRIEPDAPRPSALDYAELANALAAGDTRGASLAAQSMVR